MREKLAIFYIRLQLLKGLKRGEKKKNDEKLKLGQSAESLNPQLTGLIKLIRVTKTNGYRDPSCH